MTFGPGNRQLAQRIALGTLALSILAIGGSVWRLMRTRGEVEELRFSAKGRQTRLAENRLMAGSVPKGPKPDALDRSRAVSKLRATLTTLANQKGFAVDEFQASTEEAPYITVYALDNKDPGWMQVPVRAVLKGRSTVVMAAVAALRGLDVPFEVDSMEVTRRSTDNSGMATVAAQVGMRVLVYRGEG